MIILNKARRSAKEFVLDYMKRHKHPVNAFLHILGVPMAFYGLFRLLMPCSTALSPSCNLRQGRGFGLLLLVLGYILQYFGHKSQGNEVGEVTLIKSLVKSRARRSYALR